MAANERPGVYSTYTVTSGSAGGTGGKTIGLAAVAAKGETGKLYTVTSLEAGRETFGAESTMAALLEILFQNGAGPVHAVAAAVNDTADESDYAAAFAVLMADSDIGIMVCDSQAEAVHAKLRAAILGASENYKYRIGVVEQAGAVSALVDAAEDLNCERMVLVGPTAVTAGGSAATAGSAAAAVAGVLAAGTDPALPLNGAELFGLSGLASNLSDGDITTLVQGGVTPLEQVGSSIQVVRGITTRTTTGGEADTTWREITTISIVDYVLPAIRASLRTRFARAKNTAQTRGAIRTQVIIELENALSREIIDSYDGVTVAASEEDATRCVVTFSFAVAHGLNQIYLTANITV